MQTEIQALNFPLTDSLHRHCKRRLGFSLSSQDDHIRRVAVRLSDINGPKGGQDMCCHIQVVLKGLPDVVIKDTEADLYTAIDRAADRAEHTVARRIGKERAFAPSG